MRKAVCLWVGVLAWVASATCMASGDGLQPRIDGMAWEGLQGRLAFGTTAPFRADLGNADTDSIKVNSLSLMGDYYLSQPRLGTTGGLRATSGLLFGSRTALWSSPLSMDRRSSPDSNTDNSTTPYLGVGYTSLSSKGGWGLSADLGLMALNPQSAVRLGKVFSGTQSLDDTVRDMRLSPLLQVGVSYSF